MDKVIFFLIPFLLGLSLLSIPNSYAEIEKGINYDKEVLQTFSDGSQKIKFTSHPERILVNGIYEDSKFSENETHLFLETGHGSVKLSKQYCSFDFYVTESKTPYFTDSIVAKMSNFDLNSWNEIKSISDANCETYGSKDQLVAKKYVENVGFIEYKYITLNGKWKTQLEATNLSQSTNKKFGFSQTILLNSDTIQINDNTINLDNFDNQTFKRAWIEDNETKIINFMNDLSFDFDLAFENLDSIYILNPGKDKTKITFNFLHNQTIILPGQTLIEDPTFSSTASSEDSIQAPDATPANCNGKTISGLYGNLRMVYDATICRIPYFSYNIASIPTTATVSSATWTYDSITSSGISGTGCKLFDASTNPTGTQGDYDSVFTATAISSAFTSCKTLQDNNSVTINSAGLTKIQENISAGNGYYALYIFFNTEPVLGESFWIRQSDATLQIIYTSTPSPNAITDLTASSITQTTAQISFTAPNLNGESLINYMLNVTTPQASTAPTFNQNSSSTTINLTGLTLGTGYTAQASAYTLGGANWTYANVLNFTTASFNPPGAPTLGASALSDTALRLTSVAGTAGDNSTIWYGIQCSLNGAAFSTVVSNSSLTSRVYEITGLTLGDVEICQWRDGSVDGWSGWSDNATDTLVLSVISGQRTTDPNDRLLTFIQFVDSYGGVYFGLGAIPFSVMLIGFMAGKKTVRIFTLITLSLMGIIHASGYYVYPDWYWTLAILFAIGLVLGRQKSD